MRYEWDMQCPCGSQNEFKTCCEPLLKGAPAASPEALMRSRFTAFTRKDMDYIAATTDPQARHEYDPNATREWAEQNEFFKLEVLNSSDEGNKGKVEFKAHYRDADGKAHIHHEFSKFRKQGGRWYFRDGRQAPPETAANPN